MNSPVNPWRSMRLVIPESFEDCLSYGQRQYFLYKMIEELQDRVEVLEQKVEELENGNS